MKSSGVSIITSLYIFLTLSLIHSLHLLPCVYALHTLGVRKNANIAKLKRSCSNSEGAAGDNACSSAHFVSAFYSAGTGVAGIRFKMFNLSSWGEHNGQGSEQGRK